MVLPAVFAFAGADISETGRSRAAIIYNTEAASDLASSAGRKMGDRVFIQITKQPAELTLFLLDDEGSAAPVKTWPICAFSGGLGPKKAEGDRMAPEGIYMVSAGAMNPASSYHLSFNMGYPNAFDRAHGYTGSYLMVHGDCVSIGCYAMTNAGIEEIWTFMQAAYENGQAEIPVHAFPFEMTAANLQRHSGSANSAFWRQLAPIWAQFAQTGKVPQVSVEGRSYQLVPPA